MTKLRFDGRSVIVTGGGRGVGRAHALLLGSLGARVVVADIGGNLDGHGASAAPAQQVAEEIRAAGGDAVACFASVAEEAGAKSIVQSALDAFGRLDVVINNAGIVRPESFEEEGIEKFRRMMDVHYIGTVNVTKEAWPHLRASDHGRVVNTCSEAMLGIHPYMGSYGGAKGGIFGFTRALAAEAAESGVLVNAIAPRATTRMSTNDVLARVFDVSEEKMKALAPDLPPAVVAPVAAFLAHESCTLNGEILCVGGGQVQRLAFILSNGIYDPNLTPEFVATNLEKLLDLSNAQPVILRSAYARVQSAIGR